MFSKKNPSYMSSPWCIVRHGKTATLNLFRSHLSRLADPSALFPQKEAPYDCSHSPPLGPGPHHRLAGLVWLGPGSHDVSGSLVIHNPFHVRETMSRKIFRKDLFQGTDAPGPD